MHPFTRLHPSGGVERYKSEDERLFPNGEFDMSLCAQSSFLQFHGFCAFGMAGDFRRFIESVNDQDPIQRDAELIRRIAGQDRNAFAEFYDLYSALMFSIACKILNDATEAEDVLQETFVQIWEKAEKFDGKLGRASSWAAILVRNKAIDRLRASQRRYKLAEDAGVEFTSTKAETTANDTVHGHENAGLIQSAIVKLPEEQRQAIELAYFSGLTQDEISKKLKEPLGTIKARIRRGLLKLRDQLEGIL